MSNFGQVATALVGGVIGFFAGGPTGALYGLEIGLIAGTVLSPTRLPGTSGPRLTDGQTTTATLGDPVAFGYGFFAVSGTVNYLGAMVQTSTTSQSSGKGNPTQSQTTFSYTQSIGIGLCEGPIGSLRRVWENGQLVYDARPHLAGESAGVFQARLDANEAYAATFVLYVGDETQLADPTIEADKGVGNVPAFRGLAYIVYPNRKLRDDQGQRHPTFKFEVHVPVGGYYDTDDSPADLQSIITLICARCGYDTVTQVDASDMAATTVDGYVINRVMAGRDALVPLRSVGLFDCVESGPKLKFVKRGHAPVVTLGETDIGVYDDSDSSSSDPDAAVTVVETQEVELPRQIRVQYTSSDLDYEDGEQLSPSRFDTDSVNDVDIEIAVVMSDTQALQLAEVLWASAWAARYTYTYAVDQGFAYIEPSDCVLLPVQGSLVRARTDKVNDASQILRKITAISDDDGSYVSESIAAAPGRPRQTLSVLSNSLMVLMDLPAINDADDDPGFYAVAYGDMSGNAWNSAVIYKSSDAGVTFNQMATLAGSPPIAQLTADLPAGITTTWDDENIVFVQAIKGEFDSRTDDAVLGGANTVAVGADGRWEVLQFGVAEFHEDTAGDFYQLSHLLRGRRGTEHNVGTGTTGDKVVGLTMGNLYRLPLQASELNKAIVYKAVSAGLLFATGIDQTFTGHGVALKPFSPVYAAGEFSGSDFVISWIRRDRLSQVLNVSVDLPNSDVPEAYDVDVFDGTAVVRTLHSSTPTVTYLAADITADFGSAPTSFTVAIYQLSPSIGRGYAEEVTLP